MKTILTLLVLALATPAFAQPRCASIEAQSEHLATEYGETVQMLGEAFNGDTMALWANTETGSWSVTFNPSGTTRMCLVASGTAFEATPTDPASMGDDT